MADLVPLSEILELLEPSEVIGDEDSDIYALLFYGPLLDQVTDTADQEGVEVDSDELDELSESSAGIIMYLDKDGSMSVSFHDDQDELEDEWASLKEEAEETDEDEEDEEWD